MEVEPRGGEFAPNKQCRLKVESLLKEISNMSSDVDLSLVRTVFEIRDAMKKLNDPAFSHQADDLLLKIASSRGEIVRDVARKNELMEDYIRKIQDCGYEVVHSIRFPGDYFYRSIGLEEGYFLF